MTRFAIPILFFTLLASFLIPSSFAQESSTEVKARVGEFTLSIEGYASQEAAILLIAGDQTIDSIIADSQGQFRFSDVPVNRGLTKLCFRQIDLRSLGQSYSCLTIPPVDADVFLKDIYLAPTLGLERSTISFGSSGLAFGYSMPRSKVTMKLSTGTTYQEEADDTGYYSFTVGNLKEGSYSLSSTGNYQTKDSLKPEQNITLRVLVSSAQSTNEGLALRQELLKNIVWIVLVSIMGLGVLIALLYRLRPQWFDFFVKSRLFIAVKKRFRRKLHHAWFVGY